MVGLSRVLLGSSIATLHALAIDPDLGRWVESIERVLDGRTSPRRLEALLALLPRFIVAASIRERVSCDLPLRVGAGGRARIPTDGRVIQAPPSHLTRVIVDGGQLINHSRAARSVRGFELVDGDSSGGAIPAVEPLSGGAVFQCQRTLEPTVDLLHAFHPRALEEAEALCPVLVPVRTASPEISHSAGLQSARGAIWLSFPPNPLVVAETILHESSHVLFHLMEDTWPVVVEPDTKRFVVPWRPDQRPLRAVLMGYHAWVRIYDFLLRIEGPLNQRSCERREIIGQALAQAKPILEKATGYSSAGRTLFEVLAERHEALFGADSSAI